METMGVLGFVLGVFGLMAYLSISPLKRKVEELESALAKIEGTSYHEDRESLYRIAQSLIGKNVKIDLTEGHEDVDIVMYGNTKHGSNTIIDVDRDWMAVEVAGPKGTKTKLIRMESIQRITEE